MTATSAHDPRAVANRIIEIANEKELDGFTPMQIIKLVYFADGWSLALLDKSIHNSEAYAWRYGPVIPEVYWAFERFGRTKIDKKACDDFGIEYESNFSQDEETILEEMVDIYGQLHAFEMSDITHEEGTPWYKAYQKGERSVIPKSTIRAHFKELDEQAG